MTQLYNIGYLGNWYNNTFLLYYPNFYLKRNPKSNVAVLNDQKS